ncbi:MAG: hypothetical protein HYU64_07900 [Armatimonadetes bacterium]|nr:hypothetical protein [Armatimonadota bacterium]
MLTAPITAAALQDNGAGKLVGAKTYGKGTVQSIYPLSDGSAVKLTVAHYVTPNGEDIHKKGIAPDVQVEVKKEVSSPSESLEGADRQDIQLRRALELMSSELAKK